MMKKIPKIVFCMLALATSVAWSETKNSLVELDDLSLGMVEGQAGVDLSLKLSLNQKADYSFDTTVCKTGALEYCRLAVAGNNRYDDGSNDTYVNGVRVPSTTGKKLWIVFKGIQGTIMIDKLGLDGADVAFKSKTLGTDIYRGALNFSFDPNKPIKIRNFGFQSLSLETDTLAQETGVAGYLNTTKYTSSDSVFDASNPDITGATVGREKGFLGMSMNGNLALTGNIKIFSCIDHSRC